MPTRPARAFGVGPTIRLSSGAGAGPTRLAAFDAALEAAGVSGFNLLPLSSVIPPGSCVQVVAAQDQVLGDHGDLLYCVYAAAYADVPGDQAWAGVVWALRDDGSGAGLFAEQHAGTEDQLQAGLGDTMASMMASRPHPYAEAGRLVASATCTDQPVASVVLASYLAVGWPAAVHGATVVAR